MKIGIVTSGNDNLALFKFLNTYDNEYVVYYDFASWPYGERSFDDVLKSLEKGVTHLKKIGVEKIIVPPTFELAMKDECILPLFKTYLLEYVFHYSLVGKIGIVGDFVDQDQIEKLLKVFQKNYNLNDHQKNIKKFHSSFVYRFKSMSLRKYFLNLSYSNYLVNKIIKFDLRYFKDAGVDSLIPLNYGYFNYEKTINKYLNFHKTRFHTFEKVEQCFKNLVSQCGQQYSITVFYTGHYEFLKNDKKMMWLLQKGKNVKIKFEKI